MKCLWLEKKEVQGVHEQSRDERARIILFEVDPETGALCVEDILEVNTAWQAVDIILGPSRLEEFIWDGLQIKDGEIKIDLVPDLKFKTREVRVRRVLEKLETHFKTGLSISKPPDQYARGKGGRFASKETLP